MKALVLSSGGVDSTTCLGLAVDKYGSDNVIALAITYGQRHTKEIEAAKAVAAYYHVEMLHLDLTPIFQYSDCSLLSHSDQAIPEESYAEQLQHSDGKPVSTYAISSKNSHSPSSNPSRRKMTQASRLRMPPLLLKTKKILWKKATRKPV